MSEIEFNELIFTSPPKLGQTGSIWDWQKKKKERKKTPVFFSLLNVAATHTRDLGRVDKTASSARETMRARLASGEQQPANASACEPESVREGDNRRGKQPRTHF